MDRPHAAKSPETHPRAYIEPSTCCTYEGAEIHRRCSHAELTLPTAAGAMPRCVLELTTRLTTSHIPLTVRIDSTSGGFDVYDAGGREAMPNVLVVASDFVKVAQDASERASDFLKLAQDT